MLFTAVPDAHEPQEYVSERSWYQEGGIVNYRPMAHITASFATILFGHE